MFYCFSGSFSKDHFALFVFWIEYGTSSEMNVLQEKNAIYFGGRQE